MLYTKGERRYVEATQSEILDAASEVFLSLNMTDQGIMLSAQAGIMRAWEKLNEKNELLRRAAQKENLLPGHKAGEPRSGGEPA